MQRSPTMFRVEDPRTAKEHIGVQSEGAVGCKELKGS